MPCAWRVLQRTPGPKELPRGSSLVEPLHAPAPNARPPGHCCTSYSSCTMRSILSLTMYTLHRSPPASATASVHAVPSKLASPACTKGQSYVAVGISWKTYHITHDSGAATTASRLGMPDLAIATLNDFVEAGAMHASLDPTVPVIADADTG